MKDKILKEVAVLHKKIFLNDCSLNKWKMRESLVVFNLRDSEMNVQTLHFCEIGPHHPSESRVFPSDSTTFNPYSFISFSLNRSKKEIQLYGSCCFLTKKPQHHALCVSPCVYKHKHMHLGLLSRWETPHQYCKWGKIFLWLFKLFMLLPGISNDQGKPSLYLLIWFSHRSSVDGSHGIICPWDLLPHGWLPKLMLTDSQFQFRQSWERKVHVIWGTRKAHQFDQVIKWDKRIGCECT